MLCEPIKIDISMYRTTDSSATMASAAHTSQRHFLRQSQREVLTEMILSAVPLHPDGTPLSTDPTNAGTDSTFYVSHTDAARSSGLIARSSNVTYPPPAHPHLTTVWRLLIFDDWGRDIIAPLLRVRDLRDLGVTLYMHLDMVRDAVPGAPALYLCAPTPANITRIAADCAEALYEWVYLNFTSPIARAELEQLAGLLAQSGLPSIRHIRVVDRTLNYTALEEDLFSLMLPRSFLTLHAMRGVSDAAVESHLRSVVTGLMHVLLSQQMLPVIAHARSPAAEAVAQRLRSRLSDAVREGQLTPAPMAVYGRPLLLLVDRATDLATALHHPFGYRGLLVELGHMHLNKCRVKGKDGVDEVVEVDPDKDAFYRQHADRDFAEMGSYIESALREYKADYAALAASSTEGAVAGAGAEAFAMSGKEENGAEEAETVAMSRLLASAPRLAERKRYLDAHTKLAYSFLQTIRQRGLDRFHGVELGVMHHDGLDKEEFVKLLDWTRTATATAAGAAETSAAANQTDSDNNTLSEADRATRLADQQRLLLVTYLLCNEGSEESFVRAKLEAFAAAHPFPALTYLKYLRQWSMDERVGGGSHRVHQSPTTSGLAASGGSGSSNLLATGQGLAWGLAQQIAKNIAHSLGGVTDTDCPLTKLVDALLQDSSSSSSSGPVGNSAVVGGRNVSGGGLTESAEGVGGGYRSRGGASNAAANVSMDNGGSHGVSSPTRPAGGGGGGGAVGLRQNLIDSVTAYDPRTNKPVDLHTARFSQAVVFVLGGGSTTEYDNLKTWERARPRKSVSYGCTALLSGEELLAQLSELGAQVA